MTADAAEFAHDTWTGASLPSAPAGYQARRDNLHRLAYAVVAEARHRQTERFGLRYTTGGFGTPVFGSGERVRVADGALVHEQNGTERRAPITTLAAAAKFVGIDPGTAAAEHDSPELGDLDRDLDIDADLTDFLDAWYGMAVAALRAAGEDSAARAVGEIQLWPGHFDPAVEIGDQDAGSRATYGASPGDAAHPEPYLYVGPWGEIDRDDPFWNESAFTGASLPFAELSAASDPVATATNFYREAIRRLS